MELILSEHHGKPIYAVSSWLERRLMHGFCDRTIDISSGAAPWTAIGATHRLLLLAQHHSKTIIHLNSLADMQSLTTLEAHPLAGDAWVYDPTAELLRQCVIGVKTADCFPILIASTKSPIVAAIHCGWRGAENGLLLDTLVLLGRMGLAARSVEIAIGPGAQKCCYEIGGDVQASLERASGFVQSMSLEPAEPVTENRDGKTYANLPALLISQALFFGVKRQQIALSGICTICDQRFFSHRREKDAAGRQVSFIGGIT